MNRMRAFTLLELMITLSIVSLVVALMVPSLRHLVDSKRLESLSSSLLSTFHYARTEAIKRGQSVRVRPRGGVWSNGAIIDVFDFKTNSWKVEQHIDMVASGSVSSSQNNVTFQSNGFASSQVELKLCNQDNDAGKVIIIANSGRVNVCNANAVCASDEQEVSCG